MMHVLFTGGSNRKNLDKGFRLCYKLLSKNNTNPLKIMESWVSRSLYRWVRTNLFAIRKRMRIRFDQSRNPPTREFRVVGGMATMPGRLKTLKIALPSILRQVDKMYVFLDGHSEVPAFIRNDPKIVPILGETHPNLHSAGKFLALIHEQETGVFASFDDDIYYPFDYVQVLLDGLKRLGQDTIVGFHGVDLPETVSSFRSDCRIIYFGHVLEKDRRVDLLGTGTCAFQMSSFRFDPTAWEFENMSDLQMGLEAAEKKIPMICLERRKGFMLPIEHLQKDSIFASLLSKKDVNQTQLAQRLVTLLKENGLRD